MVLLALCDNANDQGECYPSISTIAIKCSMGERTVQGHITDMESMGIIRRELRNGRSTIYHIDQGRFDTPAESAPPQNPHPTPAKAAPPPPQILQKTPADLAPRTVKEPSKEPPVNRTKARGTRLQEEWALPKAWGVWAMEKRQWTEEFVRETADAFRDHWIAKPGTGGVKLDWLATWRNWVRNARGPQQTGRTGPGWWTSDDLKLDKGKEMGMTPHLGESMFNFEKRLRAAIDNGGKEPPPQRMSRVGIPPEPASPAGKMSDEVRAQLKALTGRSGANPKKSTNDEDPQA
ncbi:helix-turn-helix domain-containing protein [Massilia sp. TSP1-1-2]|uniref:helix-turn-helix domain-containing protein n=1 Tax=Massilia sp. TSP1-1-2 TaxID=2804649 RepID=UPI003CF3EAE5